MAEKIGVNAALDLIERETAILPALTIPLDDRALGYILASPITAACDAPRSDCSAMDGFAVASGRTLGATMAAPATFTLANDIPAGAARGRLRSGHAAPISTGAPIPRGADAVVPLERCVWTGDMLRLSEPVARWRNVRRRAEDARAGRKVAAKAAVLSPERIGALLSYGVREVEVRSRPRIAIFPTGSELSARDCDEPSARLDSNGPMIGAMCQSLGLEYWLSPIVNDELSRLCCQLMPRNADAAAEIIVSTGGVSVGSHDHVREALDLVGARIIFHGVAMRPGKPILFAILPDGRPFFGLPGNPVAALVGFRFFALAAIRNMLGLPREAGIPILPPSPARSGTTLFLRARRDAAVPCGAALLADQRSHVLGSVAEADCWVRIDDTQDETPGRLYDMAPKLD